MARVFRLVEIISGGESCNYVKPDWLTMFKKEAKAMLFITIAPILIGLGAAVIAPSLFDTLCANSILEEIPSPDNKYKIVIFTRDCGATTGFSTQVSVIARDKDLRNKPGNIFIVDCDHGKAPAGQGGGPVVKAGWDDNGKIFLQHHENARVFKAESGYKGIEITYYEIK